MSAAPAIEVERLGPARWHWRILHPRTGSPLLAATTHSRRSAQAHATQAAQHWTVEYGHLLSP